MLRTVQVFLFITLVALPALARAQFPAPKAIGALEGLRRGLSDVVRAASQSSSSGPSSPLIDAQTAHSVRLLTALSRNTLGFPSVCPVSLSVGPICDGHQRNRHFAVA